jgi:hypothetical protein
MTKNQKIAIGVGAGALILWAWSRNKAGKSLNPFAKSTMSDDSSSNFSFTRRANRPQSPFKQFLQNHGLLGLGGKNNMWVASHYDSVKNKTWMSHISNPSDGYAVDGQFTIGALSTKIDTMPS